MQGQAGSELRRVQGTNYWLIRASAHGPGQMMMCHVRTENNRVERIQVLSQTSLQLKPSLDLKYIRYQNVTDKQTAWCFEYPRNARSTMEFGVNWNGGLTRFLSLLQINSCIISYDRPSPTLICPDSLSSDMMWRVAVIGLAPDIETQRQDFNVLRISWQSKREG